MKKIKLQSMTDFVLEQMNEVMLDGTGAVCARIGNYAHFLKQTLTLGMFVPCDKYGNVLEEPKHITETKFKMFEEGGLYKAYTDNLFKYQQAKERVLFEGFDLDEYRNVYYMGQEILHESELKHFDIEFLINEVVGEITLTQSAIKKK